MVTLEKIDTSRMEDLLFDLAKELGEAPQKILANEVSLFLREVIRKTAPDNKKQGEDAVRRDLRKVFTPVQQGFLDRIGSEYGTREINTWITTKTGDKHMNLVWNILDANGDGMAKFHRGHRNTRGRIPVNFKGNDMSSEKWNARYVVTKEDYAAYRDKVLARVGLVKSGWMKSLTAADATRAASMPDYIRRHGDRMGSVQNNLHDTSKPFIAMGNHGPGIQQTAHFVAQAVKTREVALGRRLRRAIAGIHDDVAAGRRVGKIEVTNE